MKEIAAILVLLGFFTLILSGSIIFLLRKKFKERLHSLSAQSFAEIFGSGSFLDSSPNMTIGFLKYIQKRGYISSGDEKLIRLGDWLRLLYRIYFFIFVATVASMLLIFQGKA